MPDSLTAAPLQRIVTLTPNPVLDRTLTVPRVLLDTVLRADEVRLDAGGKGFNVSRALKVMGTDTLAMALAGGATGTLLEQMLHDWGVATHFVWVHDETRTNIVVTEADGARHLKVNEPGPLVSAEELARLLAAVEAEVRPGDLWVLAGSLPRGVPADLYARLIECVQSRGALAVLDASGAGLKLGLQARPFLAKPNALEAAEVTGLPVATVDDAVSAAKALCAQGVAVVAISLGSDGLMVAAGGPDSMQVCHAQPPSVQALNTVGAGDAAVAGMVWALAQGKGLDELARWGAACGTAAAMRAGVTFGTFAEVEAIAQAVRLFHR